MLRNRLCNSVSGCKTIHVDTVTPEAQDITAESKSVAIDSGDTDSNYSRTELENLDANFDLIDEVGGQSILFTCILIWKVLNCRDLKSLIQ